MKERTYKQDFCKSKTISALGGGNKTLSREQKTNNRLEKMFTKE